MPALIIEGRTTAMEIATLGLDLGKRVVHVVGLDRAGSIVLRRRVSRDRVLTLTANLPRCVIGIEACCGAPPGPEPNRAGTRGAADAARVRAPLRQEQQE
jgi:hypothetical protein